MSSWEKYLSSRQTVIYLAELTACKESITAASSCREQSNAAVSKTPLATEASTLYALRSRSERDVPEMLYCSGSSRCTLSVNKLATASSGHRLVMYWHSNCAIACVAKPQTCVTIMTALWYYNHYRHTGCSFKTYHKTRTTISQFLRNAWIFLCKILLTIFHKISHQKHSHISEKSWFFCCWVCF